LRPANLDGHKPSLWGSQGVRPAAVSQGDLGDCWWLVSLAALAEWPEKLKAVFGNIDQYPEDGMFKINFHVRGEKKRVTIDDLLPVKKWGSGFKTINSSKSPNGAWWGPIIEKAAAKFFGRYENMDGGFPTESFYALTGKPTHQYVNAKTDESLLWSALVEGERDDLMMAGSVVSDGR